eukprot:gene3577-4505_t
MFAPIIAAKLKTWSEDGEEKLKKILAKMGIPLASSKQKYSHLSANLLRAVDEKLEGQALEEGLTELRLQTFVIERGYKLQLSATDVALGTTALLESTVSDSGDWSDNWRKACGALSKDQWEVLRSGIIQTLALQRAIVTQVGLAVSNKKLIRRFSHFKVLNLKENCSTTDAVHLQHPLALTRLALFLQEATVGSKASAAGPKPVVVVSPELAEKDEQGFTYVLVVGLCGKPRDGTQLTNFFAHTFQVTIERLAVENVAIGFNPSVVKIRSDGITSYLEELDQVEREAKEAHQAAE